MEWNAGLVDTLGPVQVQGATFIGSLQKGVALGCTVDSLDLKGFWTSNSVRSFLMDVRMDVCTPYVSFVWSKEKSSPEQLEIGATRTWQGQMWKVLVGSGYKAPERAVNVYVMVSL